MKSTLILSFSLLFFSFYASGQDQVYNKQYAINGSSFLSGLINLPNSPYQFTVKTYGEDKNKRFIIGLDLSSNFTVTDPSFSGGFGIIARSGKERFEDFGKKNQWRVFFGTDGLYSLNVNSFASNTRVQLGIGLAPFAGLQFRINERLAIYTEASYQALLSITPSDGNVGIGINGSFLPPTAFWVAFDFYKKKSKVEGN